MINPFFTGIDIPDAYFCDRNQETQYIADQLRNGNNIVLKAPRRIGKSSLLKHVFQCKEVKDTYNTLFVDIYGTKNAVDFQAELQSRVFSAPFAKGSKLLKELETLVKSAYIDMGELDAVSGKIQLPRLGFSPSVFPRLPLGEIFDFLEHTKKPALVVFDEFQQIEEYPERMAATLRSYIQQMNRTRFIFSGSSRHMLTSMFQLSSQPFYKSATPMDLDIIPMEIYTDFCIRMFVSHGKEIEPEAIRFIYCLFSGETYLMQESMKELFAMTEKKAKMEDAINILRCLLTRKDADYRDILNRLDNKKERNTLFCIAAEGIARGMTGSNMLKKYDLDNASSVQNALGNLMDKNLNLVERIAKGTYVIRDRLFELWIAEKGGYLDYKLRQAASRFEEQRSLQEKLPPIPAPMKQ